MEETTETTGTASMENVGCMDNNTNSMIAVNSLPSNGTVATSIGIGSNDTSPAPQHIPLNNDNNDWCYSTLARWKRRSQMWQDYLSSPKPRKVPDITEFLFVLNQNDIDRKESIQHWIWGDDEGSLVSLHNYLYNDLQMRLKQCESSITDTMAVLSCEEEQVTQPPANSIKGTELSEDQRLREELLHKFKQELLQKDLQLLQKDLQALQEDIQYTQTMLKLTEGTIDSRLQILKHRHHSKRTFLLSLARKGNKFAVSESCDSESSDASIDTRRFDISRESSFELSETINVQAQENFLIELLNKEAVCRNEEQLVELQEFVANLLETPGATKDNNGCPLKIQNIVHSILNWNPGSTVPTSLDRRLERSPPCRYETNGDHHHILWALMYRVLAILEESSLPVAGSSEQGVAPTGNGGQAQRTDAVIDQYSEFLREILPEMMHSMNVRRTSHNNGAGFQKDLARARKQVVERLSLELAFAFDFGGMGRDKVVYGILLSMVSVQVLKMQLTKVGTDKVDIELVETQHVPLLGKDFVPETMHNKVPWDMASNGVLLLASALVDLCKNFWFNSDKEPITFTDLSQGSNGQAPPSSCELLSLIGIGEFAQVVKLGEKEFMKIPRNSSMVTSLQRECNILKDLMNPEGQECIPSILPWGMSDIELSLHGEISRMKVLRLTGIVGVSLDGYCCRTKEPVHHVIKKVYDALEYAHAKGIVHLDVQPSNIIVKGHGEGIDVLLADWGCGRWKNEKIEKNEFVGFPPYAHDDLLGKRDTDLYPTDDFDFVSLGCTWYGATHGVIGWEFDSRPRDVDEEQLEVRRTKMNDFFNLMRDEASCLPRVRDIFWQYDHQGKKRTASVRDEKQTDMTRKRRRVKRSR